jgi:hypothetical protein
MKPTEFIKEAAPPAIGTKFPDSKAGVLALLNSPKQIQQSFVKTLNLPKCVIFPDPSVEGVWAVDSPSTGIRLVIYLGGYRDPMGNIRPFNDFEEGSIPKSAMARYKRNDQAADDMDDYRNESLGEGSNYMDAASGYYVKSKVTGKYVGGPYYAKSEIPEYFQHEKYEISYTPFSDEKVEEGVTEGQKEERDSFVNKSGKVTEDASGGASCAGAIAAGPAGNLFSSTVKRSAPKKKKSAVGEGIDLVKEMWGASDHAPDQMSKREEAKYLARMKAGQKARDAKRKADTQTANRAAKSSTPQSK